MGTPFIARQEPFDISRYDRKRRPRVQPKTIPLVFQDAMRVREDVFVKEQGVPLEYELDDDDGRSCHWVVYTDVQAFDQRQEVDWDANKILVPQKSELFTPPIGTVRLVPSPHPPHPRPGGKYVNGKLVNEAELQAAEAAGDHSDGPDPAPQPKVVDENEPVAGDRATSLHDGREPYVKLGRLAVSREYRGQNFAGLLVRAALDWIKEHPAFFGPKMEPEPREIAAGPPKDVPIWRGLVCCHAQEQVVPLWQKFGFTVDEKMGKWWEEGMPHVGMFQRLDVEPYNP